MKTKTGHFKMNSKHLYPEYNFIQRFILGKVLALSIKKHFTGKAALAHKFWDNLLFIAFWRTINKNLKDVSKS